MQVGSKVHCFFPLDFMELLQHQPVPYVVKSYTIYTENTAWHRQMENKQHELLAPSENIILKQ